MLSSSPLNPHPLPFIPATTSSITIILRSHSSNNTPNETERQQQMMVQVMVILLWWCLFRWLGFMLPPPPFLPFGRLQLAIQNKTHDSPVLATEKLSIFVASPDGMRYKRSPSRRMGWVALSFLLGARGNSCVLTFWLVALALEF